MAVPTQQLDTERFVPRPLKPGIYSPVPTFFLPESENLDIPTFEAHIAWIARAGIAPVIAGTMGEAIHLSHAERVTLIKAARKALDDIGCLEMPIISGTGAGSTRETIELCKEAAEAGSDYAIVIASGYFSAALANDKTALKAFWVDVSQNSPIPVMIYNYPGASGGINLDSDIIIELAAECPNICGVKLTCADIGKLARITDAVSNPAFDSKHPRKHLNSRFLVLGGWSEFILPSVYVKGHGAITGLANITPHCVKKLFDISEASLEHRDLLSEAQQLQGVLACADYTIAKSGIAGCKVLLAQKYGYGGLPRKPLPPMQPGDALNLWKHPHTQALFEMEKRYLQ